MTQCILRTSPREGRKLKNTSIYSNDFISISIQFYIAIDPINIIVRTVNTVERRIPIQFIIILKRGDERLDPEEGTGRFKNFPSPRGIHRFWYLRKRGRIEDYHASVVPRAVEEKLRCIITVIRKKEREGWRKKKNAAPAVAAPACRKRTPSF